LLKNKLRNKEVSASSFVVFETKSMTIYIRPMSQFPYDINTREGTYFDRNGVCIGKLEGNHYAVGYEGSDPRLSSWVFKTKKGLSNITTFFKGGTVEEKRQLIWNQIQTCTVPPRLSRFFNRFRDEDLYLWYLSEYDRPTAEFIKRFFDWYFNQ
jgi:hypothetical protein